ncbi:MAG TPA: signal peptidase I [Polyangia bacterium]|nr:signal peptidase I [Polyangia bacterium]
MASGRGNSSRDESHGDGDGGESRGLIGWWRRRSAFKRARVEGQHLVKESRRILKKKSNRIPAAITAEITADIKAVEDALVAGDLEPMRKAISTLDDAMDDHLAFARKSTFREYLESIGVAVLVALLLRAFVVEAFQIPSGSMIPTLQIGDHIFVSKFAFGLNVPFTDTKILQYAEPQRGDVIVFKFPKDHSIDYIKRVVGLPGDTIEVKQDEVYLNGKALPREREPRVCQYSEGPGPSGLGDERDCELWLETIGGKQHETIQEPGRGGRDFARYVVPAGHVFCMGDNRDNSSDSRVWGPVDFNLIKGKALIVWWSRAETDGWSPVAWIKAIRWDRFFHPVK